MQSLQFAAHSFDANLYIQPGISTSNLFKYLYLSLTIQSPTLIPLFYISTTCITPKVILVNPNSNNGEIILFRSYADLIF